MSSLPTPLVRKTLSAFPLLKKQRFSRAKQDWAQPCPHAKAIKAGLAAGILAVLALYAIFHMGGF